MKACIFDRYSYFLRIIDKYVFSFSHADDGKENAFLFIFAFAYLNYREGKNTTFISKFL